MRQDDFLRTLQKIAHINREGDTPDYGLAVIIDTIEKRLAQLKPIAYEGCDVDLSTGFSGGGIHAICGSSSDIRKIQSALNRSAYADALGKQLRDLQGNIKSRHYRAESVFFTKNFASLKEAKEWAGDRAMRIVKVTTIEEEIK